ncbi:MAG: methylaspartate mutase sigma subunit [Pseudonocardiales bacterium]|jgi:methylaspartate mutase sigma subunit|nr:methylaspartate mutase sigma subunit [Pseudonocardiales bacterium]
MAAEPVRTIQPRPTAVLRRPSSGGLSIVVTTVVSDSHTWNLVFLQLALEELGHDVRNLGPCVPPAEVVSECLRSRPDLLVVSTVNGHGMRDGTQLIGQIRQCPELMELPVVIGGKLGIAGPAGLQSSARLRAAGFDAVYEDGASAAALRSLPALVRAGRRL